MKKGFTLVEMLGIITVMAIILVVTFPSINSSLKRMKQSANDGFANNLKVSAETYVELNREKFPELDEEGNYVYIKVSELYDANLLKGQQEGIDFNAVIAVVADSDLVLRYYYDGREIGLR